MNENGNIHFCVCVCVVVLLPSSDMCVCKYYVHPPSPLKQQQQTFSGCRGKKNTQNTEMYKYQE